MTYTGLDSFVSKEELLDSCSRKDGVDEETETMLRRYGCDLIQESGILLRLPQAVMATGQVLLHRFYCKKSFAEFFVKTVAASCVWLAAKLEECPRKISDVLQVFHRIERRRNMSPLTLLGLASQEYAQMKSDLIRTERHVLREMGFICHVEHPHKFIISYLKLLEAPEELTQVAWNLANDSLRTTLCVRFKSEVVACGVVYAAARRFKVPLPDDWWVVFDAKFSEVEEVCVVLADLYRQSKVEYVKIGRDSKLCILNSKYWELSQAVLQELTSKEIVKGAAPSSQALLSRTSDGRVAKDPAVRGELALKDLRKDLEVIRVFLTNVDKTSAGKVDPVNQTEDDNSRGKNMGRSTDREHGRAHQRKRDRERMIEKYRERGRESAQDQQYGRKEVSRDLGHFENLGSRHSSQRDVRLVVREKKRSRSQH